MEAWGRAAWAASCLAQAAVVVVLVVVPEVAVRGEPVGLVAKGSNQRIAYSRKKLKSRGTAAKPALIRFGEDVAAILKRRPTTGPLFPYLRTVRPGDRATEFKQRCDGLGIKGVSLHSYRYAWAERALKCG